MSIWPEGYGAGPGARGMSFYCQRCGAVVMNIGVHTAWHDRVEPGEESSSTLKKVDLVPGRSVLVKSADELTEPAEEVKPIGWYRIMTAKFATAHFGFPDGSTWRYGEQHKAPDGGVWTWFTDSGNWELSYYPPVDKEKGKDS